MHSAWPLALFAVVAGTVVVGNVAPRKVSFLPGMRYYAGNWDTSLWCMKPSASTKVEQHVVAIASMPAAQMERFYGSPETAALYMYMGYAFRAFNTHGRAMFTLAHRAMAGQDEADYVLTDGERITSTAIGWNFGDGHMCNEQLIAALQERCDFEPGEVRVVLIDAQPIQRQTQRYRFVDAATGEFESGYVRVADMANSQPWTTPSQSSSTGSGTQKREKPADSGGFSCGQGRDRTGDLPLSGGRSYQLSYLARRCRLIPKPRATLTGLEPATSAVTGRRANQLRHRALCLKLALHAYPYGIQPALPP